jgi:hypothetical protein
MFKDFKHFEIKNKDAFICDKDIATILERMYTPDDGQLRPTHTVIRYMKNKNKCRT